MCVLWGVWHAYVSGRSMYSRPVPPLWARLGDSMQCVRLGFFPSLSSVLGVSCGVIIILSAVRISTSGRVSRSGFVSLLGLVGWFLGWIVFINLFGLFFTLCVSFGLLLEEVCFS